jgi:hypothetical protein
MKTLKQRLLEIVPVKANRVDLVFLKGSSAGNVSLSVNGQAAVVVAPDPNKKGGQVLGTQILMHLQRSPWSMPSSASLWSRTKKQRVLIVVSRASMIKSRACLVGK